MAYIYIIEFKQELKFLFVLVQPIASHHPKGVNVYTPLKKTKSLFSCLSHTRKYVITTQVF